MSGIYQTDPEELSVAKSHLGFPVVGIGASAGGIDALRRLIGAMPADSGMAFVVVMHLSPDHESSLAAILQRAGKMPAIAVADSTPIEANHIYVISPALKLGMTDGHLRVSALTTPEGRRQSIDLFFRSLAEAHQERSVCVVLSGTGSDGAQGLKRIKELGGVAIAQSPEDAEFDGMPRAAAQTGQVDFVLPVEEMPAKLVLLWENAKRIELPNPPADLEAQDSAGEAAALAEEALLSIKALLRERTGHDFAHYKRGTVLRRLERRMQVNALPDLPSYRRLLDAEPDETPALLQDMLISVTNFFRDPDAFAALAAALGASMAERPASEPFRAWVAGCATGEEAYSVAILLRELLGPSAPRIQVFASDIDQRAVAFGRAGLYPNSIEADVSAERLRGSFLPDPAGFRVSKPLRDAVVFSAHNVLSDPPFTRMDLICCRNLMIYLDRSAQEQLLRSFHYALKPRGLLFLGSSETADAADGIFDGVDRAHRVYRANALAPRARVVPTELARIPVFVLPPSPPKPLHVEPSRPPLEALHERVLRECAPPTVLVDADDTVLHVSERAAHLLRLPGGAPTSKLMALVRPELRAELRSALLRAAQTGEVVDAPRVRLTINGETHEVAMTARPATGELPKALTLVEFDESREGLGGVAPERDPVVESLEAELMRTQEQLRGTIGESAASTEELRASNEELQTINEELRSTTEELETSREELQGLNEELITVNGELTVRVDEAAKADDDWKNLLSSAEIGTVFIDRESRVKRYTPQAATLFNLLPSDVGRPLLDITHRMDYPELAQDIADALRQLKRVERELYANDGRRLLARAVPYRTSDDRIEGTVLAFFDVTVLRATEARLHSSERRMALVAESMREYAIVTMDAGGRIATWSPGAERIFGYSADEAIGSPFELIFSAEDRKAGAPDEELRIAARLGRANDDRWLVAKGDRKVFCSGVTTSLGNGVGFAKIARNFTDEEMRDASREAALAAERAASGRLQEISAMKDEFLAIVSHELKNPLSIIQMNAQLLSRLPGAATDARALRSAKAIISAVSSQAQIINDLLELSRVNMGKVSLAPVLLDLAELVGGIVEAAEPDAQAKGQALTAGIEAATVFGDRGRIEQIVWNLVTNAVKFTPEGGSVRVALAVEEGMARLSVEDSGIGLDPRDLHDIFEMFKQVEAGAGRTKTGLGIGLALVKQLAELHGGRVAAESEGLGHGARFSVWLPLPAGESPSLPEVAADRGLRGLRLLIVDDEPQTLTAFGELLETEEVHVTLAGSAREALALASSERFDAVVSDIAMPGENGLWLASRLREAEGTVGLAIVAVSGMARAADRARAVEAGFDALVAKPLDLDALRSEIVRVMSKRATPG